MVHSPQVTPHTGTEAGPGLDLGVPGCARAVEVGRGGFGVVYRAWQPDFHRPVAVKVLAADWHGPSRARFERELKTLGRLSDHPHIVTLHHAGRTAAGNPYLLMAYEEGGSLADLLAARKTTAGEAWPAAVAGAIAVAGALETAHRAGLLHRDVKPGNILISRYGEPKLADFGLARPRTQAPHAPQRIVASLPHAAPEVLRGEPATVVSDVYALASTLLHWIRGVPAFTADDDAVQIAPPAYGYAGGLRALSVRQYWSPACQAVMGYVWVWKQYRDNAMLDDGTWRVRLTVGPPGGARGNGVVEQAQGQPYELWTVPLTPGAGCTVVTATLTHRRTGESMTATTEPWCG